MSVVNIIGVDLGAQNTVIAVGRGRGFDIITNEVSNRSTPTLVGFGPESRYLGEAAKTNEISNLDNTIGSLKRLVGRSIEEADIQIEQQYISVPLINVDGEVGVEVSCYNKDTKQREKKQFTATQLLAMYIGKIKQTAAAGSGKPVESIALSVPVWFTERQRRNLIDACKIAGVDVKRLVNDTSAAALAYGFKERLPEEDQKPRRVVIVDVGHSTFTASVVEFRHGRFVVKGTACDRHYGGRNFDRAVFDHLAKYILTTHKRDINGDYKHAKKERARVLAVSQKAKTDLSANAQVFFNIDLGESEAKGIITRKEFEAAAESVLSRTAAPLERALADAGLTKDDIDVIELMGGSSRVPAVKERIQAFFGKTLSSTLNQDEDVARGCALAYAISCIPELKKLAVLKDNEIKSLQTLREVTNARNYSLHDVVTYPIEFTWAQEPGITGEGTSLLVFTKEDPVPKTKVLTLYRKEPFDLEARYFSTEDLPTGMSPWIARFSIKDVRPTVGSADGFVECKIRVTLTENGVLELSKAYSVEDKEYEEVIPEDEQEKAAAAAAAPPAGAPADAAAPVPEGENKEAEAASTEAEAAPPKAEEPPKPKTRTITKKITKDEFRVSSATLSKDLLFMGEATSTEIALTQQDQLVVETQEKRNELESYGYDIKALLYDDGAYAKFASEEEKEKVFEAVTQLQDWLDYEEDANDLDKIKGKRDELDQLISPIRKRYQDSEAERLKQLQEKLAAEAPAGSVDADMADAADADVE